jgi:hypothetical protein
METGVPIVEKLFKIEFAILCLEIDNGLYITNYKHSSHIAMQTTDHKKTLIKAIRARIIEP